MILRPVQKIGFRDRTMEVVTCPGCQQPAWANASQNGGTVDFGKVRTVCCGIEVKRAGMMTGYKKVGQDEK